MSRIVLMLAHSIEEYDALRMWHELGHEVASIGGYIDPAHPHDDKRPALPDLPMSPVVKRAVDALGQPHPEHPTHRRPTPMASDLGPCSEGHGDPLEAARRGLPDEIVEWADVLIIHHLEHTWLFPQWASLRGRLRVIWRTVGQSAHPNEAMMRPLRSQGLQIVRYSPRERSLPEFAGEDALIRFYKDPDEWSGWRGDLNVVTNVTQSLYKRSLADDGMLQPLGYQWTNYSYWDKATQGLPRIAAGPGSESHQGRGALEYDEMREWLRQCRSYLYTGTQPASYTLGLIEAMMTGIPVVSITPDYMRILPYGPLLFEGADIAPLAFTEPDRARERLRDFHHDIWAAKEVGRQSRAIALELFDKATVMRQWQAFLDGRPVEESVPIEAVAA